MDKNIFSEKIWIERLTAIGVITAIAIILFLTTIIHY